MTEISIRELRDHLTEYIRRVERGEQVTVTRRGKKVAVLAPADETETTRKLRELAAKGIIRWSGQKPWFPKKPIRLKGSGPSISEMIIEDRGEPVPGHE